MTVQKFVDVMKNISDFLDDKSIKQIISVYADKGYDSTSIRNYLKNKNITPCIPKRNFKKNNNKKYSDVNQNNANYNYNKVRFVVERFFAWLKNGFHRTRIRYEKKCDNYLGFVYLASIMMYWRVLG